MPLICVAIVTYRSDPTLERCIDSLEKQTFRDFEVVIVENGLTTRVDELASRLSVPVRVIRPGKNIGFAAANNLAAKGTGDGVRWLATLNPDAFAGAHWLEHFTHALKKYPHCAMFGSLQRDAARPDIGDGLGDAYHAFGLAWRTGHGFPIPENLEDAEVFSPCGGAAFYRLDMFRALGGFDEDYFCYGEDGDLGFRMRLRGQYCIQLAHAAVAHVGGASSGDNSKKSDFAVYHGLRNLVWIFVKNMPQPLFALLLPFHILAIATLALRHVLGGNGGAVLRALRDAVRGIKPMLGKRKEIQAARTAGALELMQAFSWMPGKMLRHATRGKPAPPKPNASAPAPPH
ncbi:MAG: glycosyltransferase [Alphaproteobacteria bacterium]|nr:glycosyltransferase [Alphaproteobacteria bacterium]